MSHIEIAVIGRDATGKGHVVASCCQHGMRINSIEGGLELPFPTSKRREAVTELRRLADHIESFVKPVEELPERLQR